MLKQYGTKNDANVNPNMATATQTPEGASGGSVKAAPSTKGAIEDIPNANNTIAASARRAQQDSARATTTSSSAGATARSAAKTTGYTTTATTFRAPHNALTAESIAGAVTA